ncbi:MAG: hypothetical protein JF607_06065 [Burkholderiales bacterium]|nr:hypothetical protein [Burkholderiales bacterium]
MSSAFVVVLSLHMLSATFWAGTSFALARSGGAGIERLRAPQLGAALIAVLSGGYLGQAMHGDTVTRMQQVRVIRRRRGGVEGQLNSLRSAVYSR